MYITSFNFVSIFCYSEMSCFDASCPQWYVHVIIEFCYVQKKFKDYREKIKMCFFEFLRMLYFVFFKGVHARKDFIIIYLYDIYRILICEN